jgi:membrane protease YdiL (CAAX protease family)
MFTNYPWSEFFILWAMGIVGAILVMPYALTLNPIPKDKIKIPYPALIAISIVQSVLLLGLAVGIGLLAAKAVGLGAPVIEAALKGEPLGSQLILILLPSIIAGLLVGVLIAALDRFVFLPASPEALRSKSVSAGPLKGFLASFYGGIAEELLLRLFVMSGLVWLIGMVWKQPGGAPASGAYITAALLAALLFGAGHLPATKAITPLTPVVITRALILNGLGGVVFGLLYWRFGLEAAMIAHFAGDIVIHVALPLIISPNENSSSIGS